jgi:hypothetical protein
VTEVDPLADALLKHIRAGKPIQVAIWMAAKELGLQSLQAVVSKPNEFPPAYRRLR